MRNLATTLEQKKNEYQKKEVLGVTVDKLVKQYVQNLFSKKIEGVAITIQMRKQSLVIVAKNKSLANELAFHRVGITKTIADAGLGFFSDIIIR